MIKYAQNKRFDTQLNKTTKRKIMYNCRYDNTSK